MSHAPDVAAVVAARESYYRWVSSAHTGAHARRTAERNAAFFLPHLEPGMALLDAGCGPGSITLGLAAAVAPGHVTGVDLNGESLEIARDFAAARGVANVSFEQHHLRALPYGDASFDAVFIHAVLQHVDEPGRILRELHRVLKPGGVIGVADADHDGALFWPEEPMILRGYEITAGLRGEGDVRVGKRLRALLVEAGFERVVGSVVGGADGEASVTAYNGAFWANYHRQEPLVAYAEALGLGSRQELAAVADAWERWAQDPGAFAARFWCQAVGFKP